MYKASNALYVNEVGMQVVPGKILDSFTAIDVAEEMGYFRISQREMPLIDSSRLRITCSQWVFDGRSMKRWPLEPVLAMSTWRMLLH